MRSYCCKIGVVSRYILLVTIICVWLILCQLYFFFSNTPHNQLVTQNFQPSTQNLTNPTHLTLPPTSVHFQKTTDPVPTRIPSTVVDMRMENLRKSLSTISWSGIDFSNGWRETVKSEKWKAYNLSHPTIILKFNVEITSLGNLISDYVTALSYADQTGMDFLLLSENPSEGYPDKGELPYLFPWYIHNSIRRSESVDIDTCSADLAHQCSNSIVLRSIPAFARAIQEGCLEFARKRIPHVTRENLENTISIYIRCGDILKYAHHDEYGFLPYSVYSKYIPASFSGFIDVLASPRKCTYANKCRTADVEKAEMCKQLYDDLLSWLSLTYPLAQISLREELTVGEAWYRMVFSSITICSPSTFCLWPTLSSANKSYLTRSRLFFGGQIQTLRGSNASWIENANFLSPQKIIYENLDISMCLQYLRTA